MSLFISVVVCTYNRNKILCEAIENLLAQDYDNYELLVIDQSSSHDAPTTEYLQSVDHRIRLIKPTFANLPKARNFSLQHVKGEVVVFFDDDMEVPSDTLSKIADTYTKEPQISVLTGFMSQNHKVDLVKYSGYAWGRPVTENSGIKELAVMDGGFMTFRRKVFEKIGGFDEWIGTQTAASGEDHEISIRARNAGFKIFLDTDITIENRDASEGGSERAYIEPRFLQESMDKMMFYIKLKNRPYKGLLGWSASLWSLYRFHILNSSLKASSPSNLLKRHQQYLKFYKDAVNNINQMQKTQSR